MKTQARLALETPYADQHRASVAARVQPRPKGLSALLMWFLAEFNQEMPTKIHSRGVFFGRPERSETKTLWARESKPKELVGGSLIGTPSDDGSFRAFIENRPTETDEDGNYARPMRAALSRMAGRRPTSSEWFHAHYLWAIGGAAGDWQGVALRVGIPPQVAEIYTESLLNRLWNCWTPTAMMAA